MPVAPVAAAIAALLPVFVAGPVLAQEACADTGAVFETVEGLVEIDRGSTGTWSV